MRLKVGDLVRYRNSTFVSTRVSSGYLGLVVDTHPDGEHVRVRWNTNDQKFQEMWHALRNLEPADESR